jgi:hypothetical protein
MIQEIENLPANMVGFKATGQVTAEDFTNTVMPRVKELISREGELNYLLVLDTSIKNFTIGSWIEDALMGIKHLLKWKRAAIVSDSEGIRTFTGIFSKLMPGEFRGFEHKDLQQAIQWTSGSEAGA